jgi:hypothetical protein
MQLISNKGLKYNILLIFSLLFMLYMIFYFSPLNFSIQLGNILNSKIYLNKDQYVNLPKGWVASLTTEDTIQLVYLKKKYILNNNLDIKKVTLRFEQKNNSGRIEFPSIEKQKVLNEKKHQKYGGKNCGYQIYRTNNIIDYIYIPKNNSLLYFCKFDKSIMEFIDEYCK